MYFRETTAAFPYPVHVLSRCLGPAKNKGNKMTQWVLKKNGEIVPRRTMHSLTPEELSRDSEILKRSNFTEAIKLKYGDSLVQEEAEGQVQGGRR